jgi:histidinol phosphatase-like enzyme
MARGILREEQMEAVHRAFVAIFRGKGVEFLAVEYCPHHPEGTVEKYRKACGCRKPKDGMARKVLEESGIPPSCTRWVVGDKMSDVLMGIGIGAKTILVATGYGESERVQGESAGVTPDRFLPSIREAASWILGDGK